MRSFIRLIVRRSVDLPQPDGTDEGGDLVGRDIDRDPFTARNAIVVEAGRRRGRRTGGAVGSVAGRSARTPSVRSCGSARRRHSFGFERDRGHGVSVACGTR